MALANRTTTIEQQATTAGAKTPPQGMPVVSLVLLALTFVSMMVSIWMIFLYAPTDAIEGDPQRIFYFHLPVAILGMLAFGIVTVGGLMFLWKKDERWDWAARAAAEVGAVFLTFALITGSIWGRTTWGTWWTWDARLTTTLILWFIYIGYIMLRSYMGRTPSSARAGAVLAVIGLIDIPIIYESVNWWRTLHPQQVITLTSSPQLPPEMLYTLIVSFVACTLLFSLLIVQLYQLEKMQTLAQRLRAELE